MTTTFTPIRFDHHNARLLAACGYVCEHHEASWEDIGGPESGPKLTGCDAYQAWVHTNGRVDHAIIVQGGFIVDVYSEPTNPF